jgi:hypothetical protein
MHEARRDYLKPNLPPRISALNLLDFLCGYTFD